MNRLATASRLPTVVASLDLSDDAQKRVHTLILRFHSGRWPLFRCLGMRRRGGVLYEAAEWLRAGPPTLVVLEYRRDGQGICWSLHKNKTAALAALRTLSLAP
jgi:hypothetical protein